MVAAGRLTQGEWGDGSKESAACIMGALTGMTNEKDCVAAGWPLPMVELFEHLNDKLPHETFVKDMSDLAHCIDGAFKAGGNLGRGIRDVRVNAILPIAMNSIGEGSEPWREACRVAVQWSIDNDGEENPRAARAARAAR